MADRPAHEKEKAVHVETGGGNGLRIDGGNAQKLILERQCDGFVGVENENPGGGEWEILQCPVFLARVALPRTLDDGRAH